MSAADIKAVATIMMTADHNCGFCAKELLDQLVKLYPQYLEQIKEVWATEYGEWHD